MLLGRPMIYFHRNPRNIQIQTVKFACIFGLVMTASVVFINETSVSSQNETSNLLKSGLLYKGSEKNSKMINIEGTPDVLKDVNLSSIPKKDSVTELNLNLVQFNPMILTESLKDFHNLRKINLTNVKLISEDAVAWNFNRVYLPQLKEFVVDLNFGFKEQYTDYADNLTEEKLTELLFYDITPQNKSISIDLVTKLASEQVDVSIRVDSWTVLSIYTAISKTGSGSQPETQLKIAVEFSDRLLKKFNENHNVVHLTMTECSVSKSSFPSQLKYLNLYRARITDGDIMEVLKPLTKLTDLYVELRNASMSISAIPKSVKTLAISDLNALYTGGIEETSNAETVGVGFPIDVNIVENFDKIFIKVKKVGIFEPTNGTQHLLLKNVLKSNADWVFVEGFERVGDYNGAVTVVEEEIEAFLEKLEVLRDDRHFLLVREDTSSEWRQEKLKGKQKLAYRYDFLGWSEYITWQVYDHYF